MAVLILTLLCSLFLGSALWFVFGSRFRLDVEQEANELLNFFVYYVGTLPVSFVLIFFGLG